MSQPGLVRISPELVLMIRQGSGALRRRIVEKACLRAVELTGIDSPVISEAIDVIRRRDIPDLTLQRRVDSLTQELDEAAWDIQDRVDAGELSDVDYVQAFTKARAAAAVGFALGESLAAVFDSLYEAYYAIDGRSDFLQIVAD